MEAFSSKKIFPESGIGGGRVLRNKLDPDPVRIQKPRIIPSQITLRMSVYPRRFVFVPAEKREELIKILDDTIKRLLTLINARKTKTRVRLKAE
jgi:hypothetical protein